jgi:hypothetical protein
MACQDLVDRIDRITGPGHDRLPINFGGALSFRPPEGVKVVTPWTGASRAGVRQL